MSMKDRQDKGQRLQRSTAKKIVEFFPDLDSEDVKSNPPFKHGEDILLSDKARDKLNIKIECKNYGRWKSTYTQYEYAFKHNTKGEPILIIDDEYGKTAEGIDRKPLSIMDRDYYLTLLKQIDRYKIWIKKQIKTRHS